VNWENLHTFLPVVRAGSFRKAAELTKIHYTTLARRISALEEQLGCKLILRSKQGLILTQEGQILFDDLIGVETQILGLKASIQDKDDVPSGVVRVNLARFLAHKYILPHLKSFQEKYPQIKVELIAENSKSDINQHEADIALWVIESERVPENLVGKSLGEITTYLYGTAEYIKQHRPNSAESTATIIGDMDGHEYMPCLQNSYAKHIPVGLRLEGVYVKAKAASEGHGLALLPICVADEYQNLVPIQKKHCPEPPLNLWVVTHPDLRDIVRVKCFMDFITLKLKKDHPEFWATYE
jgi:DNA-binding transcriptional LysR family regulator